MRQRNTKSDTKRFVMCPFCSARTNTAEMEPDSAACSACRGNLVVVDDCLSSDSRVACPACEQRYELTAEILNQTISCTMCELPFAVVQVRTAQTTRERAPESASTPKRKRTITKAKPTVERSPAVAQPRRRGGGAIVMAALPSLKTRPKTKKKKTDKISPTQ